MLTPKEYLENILMQMEITHEKENSDETFTRPGLPRMAKLLAEAGYKTPKGHGHWWPAQVQQLLDGRFEAHYMKAEKTL